MRARGQPPPRNAGGRLPTGHTAKNRFQPSTSLSDRTVDPYGVYASDLWTYDLAAALAGAHACEPRLRYVVDLVPLQGRRRPLPAPTGTELLAHAGKFGSECVLETAVGFGIDLERSFAETELARERREIERRHADQPAVREAKVRRVVRRARQLLRPAAIESVLAGTKTVDRVAEELGVREQTVRGWLAQ